MNHIVVKYRHRSRSHMHRMDTNSNHYRQSQSRHILFLSEEAKAVDITAPVMSHPHTTHL